MRVNSLITKGGRGHGLYVGNDKKVNINYLESTDNKREGVHLDPGAKLTVTSGRIGKNKIRGIGSTGGSAGIVEVNLNNIDLIEQINEPIHLSNTIASTSNCTFNKEFINPITWYKSKINMTNNPGLETTFNGVVTTSGDGSKVIMIPHNLYSAYRAGGVYVAHVTPRTSESVGDYSVNVNGDSIILSYNTAPPAGTDNLIYLVSVNLHIDDSA